MKEPLSSYGVETRGPEPAGSDDGDDADELERHGGDGIVS